MGSEPGQFDYPGGIAVDGSGNVYVADTDNHRVQKFTSDGTFLTQWGSAGQRTGAVLQSPGASRWTGAATSTWRIRWNDRVQKFTVGRDLSDPVGELGQRTGAVQRSLGHRGGRERQRLRGGYRGTDRVQKFTVGRDLPDPVGKPRAANRGSSTIPGASRWTGAATSTWRILEPPRAKVHLGRDLPDPVGKRGQRTGAVRLSPGASRWTGAATSTWRIRTTTACKSSPSDGTFLTQWGSGGSGPGQFYYPVGYRGGRERQRLRGGYV